MLENTEGAIKNGQSRETGKTKKTKTKTQHIMLDTTICKETQITKIRHEPSYKQLEVKTNRTSFSSVNIECDSYPV